MNQAVPVRPYGFLLLLKLLSIAATDDRLSRGDLQTLTVLVGFSSQYYETRVSQGTIASKFGISRQAAQKRIRRVAALGYLVSTSNSLSDGRSGSNTYRFNVELAGQVSEEPATPEGCSGGDHIELSIGNRTQVAQRESFRESRIDNGRDTQAAGTGRIRSSAATVSGKETLSETEKAEAISKIQERLRNLASPIRKGTIPLSVWVQAIRLAVQDVDGAIHLLTTWKFDH
jgi:hypothetical protein